MCIKMSIFDILYEFKENLQATNVETSYSLFKGRLSIKVFPQFDIKVIKVVNFGR